MKVLVACEFSGIVRDAFIQKGHDAVSCDLLPTEREGPHIQDDVLNYLNDGWDLMIAHPPCTYLANSGVRWLYNADGTRNELRWQGMISAAIFFKKLFYAPIPKIAIENPVMHRHGREKIGIGPCQIIQPWWFGNPNKKATGLYLKNLPPLVPTKIVPEEKRIETIFRMTPSEHRPKDRAVTFREVAAAMADQWGAP